MQALSIPPLSLPAAPAEGADWAFCRTALEQVSRTFTIPVRMLRPSLEVPVTLGYLLCRVVDTVEDDATIDGGAQDALYERFIAVLAGDAQAEAFSTDYERLAPHADPADPSVGLCLDLARVMRVVGGLPATQQDILGRWVTEMSLGMRIYSHRTPGPDGVTALLTLTDLERYCYFVAGTVGHLLTELFVDALKSDGLASPEVLVALQADSESFGLGLQLTNILKDVTDDLERGQAFIPRSLCDAVGLDMSRLADEDPDVRRRAHQAVIPVFERAEEALDSALSYTLAVPAAAVDIRRFCLLPLWMARATLSHAKGNDAQFIHGQAVKITRAQVGSIVQECVALSTLPVDDVGVRAAWLRLGRVSGADSGVQITQTSTIPTVTAAAPQGARR